MARLGITFKVSDASIVIDRSKFVSPVKSFEIAGKALDDEAVYKVASTDGIIQAFALARAFGLDLGVQNIKDTHIEAWRAVLKSLKSISPLSIDQIKFNPRVRFVQPDIQVPHEFVRMQRRSEHLQVNFRVYNAGLADAKSIVVTVKLDNTPDNPIDDNWQSVVLTGPQELAPSAWAEYEFSCPLPSTKAVWPIQILVAQVPGELEVNNNKATVYVDLKILEVICKAFKSPHLSVMTNY